MVRRFSCAKIFMVFFTLMVLTSPVTGSHSLEVIILANSFTCLVDGEFLTITNKTEKQKWEQHVKAEKDVFKQLLMDLNSTSKGHSPLERRYGIKLHDNTATVFEKYMCGGKVVVHLSPENETWVLDNSQYEDVHLKVKKFFSASNRKNYLGFEYKDWLKKFTSDRRERLELEGNWLIGILSVLTFMVIGILIWKRQFIGRKCRSIFSWRRDHLY